MTRRTWDATPGTNRPLDHARLAALAAYLNKTSEIEAAYSLPSGSWEGAPGSKARQELEDAGPDPAKPWDPRHVRTAYAVGHMGLLAVVEQALAIARLLNETSGDCPGILAAEVCSRSACEIGARTWWLLDPAVSTRQRLARHFYLQLYSALELEALGQVMGWPDGDLRYSQPTRDVCLERSKSLGLSCKIMKGRSGREHVQDVDGVQLPATTTLVAEVMKKSGYGPDSQMVYRLQSATSHGIYYSLIRSYRANNQSGEGLVRRVPDQRVVVASAGLTLWAFNELLGRVVELMGWSWIRAESFRQMIDRHLAQEP